MVFPVCQRTFRSICDGPLTELIFWKIQRKKQTSLTYKIMRSRSGNVVNFKVFHLIDPTVSTSLILLAPRGGYLAHCADVSCSDSTRDWLVLIIGKGQGECKIGTWNCTVLNLSGFLTNSKNLTCWQIISRPTYWQVAKILLGWVIVLPTLDEILTIIYTGHTT